MWDALKHNLRHFHELKGSKNPVIFSKRISLLHVNIYNSTYLNVSILTSGDRIKVGKNGGHFKSQIEGGGIAFVKYRSKKRHVSTYLTAIAP